MTISPIMTKECTIEVPKEWISELNIANYQKANKSYLSSVTEHVPLSIVQPPTRNIGVTLFRKDAIVSILNGIVKGDILPPIEVYELEDKSKYRYAVQNGFHRFYASIAIGFEEVPIEIKPYFNINNL